ncbi:unnamed protein product, partial [Cyprideis torosa]
MSTNTFNAPGEIKPSNEFDIEKFHQWFRANSENVPEQLPAVKQFSGGASNLTFSIDYGNDQSYIMRTSPPGYKAASAHDMGRESTIMSSIKDHFPYVPKIYGFCDDEAVIGRDFFIMEYLKGFIPSTRIPESLNWNSDDMQKLNLAFIDRLVDLHQMDYKSCGLDSINKGSGYLQRQVRGWSGRYQKARTWNVPSCKRLMKWLEDNIPKEEYLCLIHNDYRLDNVVINPKDSSDIIGILDWELSTIGDALSDVGTLLTYWIEAKDPRLFKTMSKQPSHMAGMLTREEIIDYYSSKMGIKSDNWIFYQVFGAFKLIVIAQQIYYRNVISALVNQKQVEINSPIEADADLVLLRWEDDLGKKAFWHSSAHLLAQALVQLYPKAKLTIGPPIEQGFYYDVDFGGEGPSENDFSKIEALMLENARKGSDFELYM